MNIENEEIKTKPRGSESALTGLVRFAGRLCGMIGHRMLLDSDNAAGTATCKWCGHKKPAIEWDRI